MYGKYSTYMTLELLLKKMIFIPVLFNVILTAATASGLPAFEAGDPMVVTVGNDVGWQALDAEEGRKAFEERGELRCSPDERMAPHWEANGHLYGEHGITAFEPYVKWMLMEPEQGVWDPAFYDAELTTFKRHGLRWVPFLIGGPAYATPPWFKESSESVFAVDLRTGLVTRDQSIWNPHLRPRLRAWLARFFEHYDHEDMQAVLLGISGVFGESIYTASGNEWTQIWDGKYPQHVGWWCGDAFAAADFRGKMREKYGKISRLNQAWDTTFATFDKVAPFVPDEKHTDRARLDLVQWYMRAMTDYAEWWVATTRELAPTVPVLLCTGGSGLPELGADMAGQTKMVARHGAGMRITNEASDYGENFHLTRMVGSASLHYGAYFGYEPAGAVDENGIVARVYNAVASGAWEFFHYDNPPRGDRGERYKRCRSLMHVRTPVIEVGMFWSRTSADLKKQMGLTTGALAARDLCDLAYVDERMIQDGALASLNMLLWTSGPVTEAHTAKAIRKAVKKGMTLVIPADWRPVNPEGKKIFPARIGWRLFKKRGSGPVARIIPLGKGHVIKALEPTPMSSIAAMAAMVRQPEKYGIPPLSEEAAMDGKMDKIYVTVTTEDLLLYNHGDQPGTVKTPQAEVEVPAHAIVSVPRRASTPPKAPRS